MHDKTIEKFTPAQLSKKAKELALEANTKAEITNALFEEFVEDKLIQPTFLARSVLVRRLIFLLDHGKEEK